MQLIDTVLSQASRYYCNAYHDALKALAADYKDRYYKHVDLSSLGPMPFMILPSETLQSHMGRTVWLSPMLV